MPGYAIDGWFGLLSSANTPLARQEAMWVAVKRALDDPVIRERFAALYMEVIPQGPKEFAATVAASDGYFRKIVGELQLAAQ